MGQVELGYTNPVRDTGCLSLFDVEPPHLDIAIAHLMYDAVP
jgi:hypothetical protein